MLSNLRLMRRVGAGAFGEVYEAKVAVKLAPREGRTDAALALEREAFALLNCARSNVPHVVGVVDYYTSQYIEQHKFDALVMPMLQGGSLEDKLAKGPIGEQESREIVQAILEALVGLHENAHMTHRDIKPSNIMFENGKAVLIDFGVSSSSDRPTTPVGTPYYMAPEVWGASAKKAYTYKADLWSLGVLLYQSLTGEVPFQAASVAQLYTRLRAYLRHPERLNFPSFMSDSCKEFILTLLAPEACRPTAQEALCHPWLQERPHHKAPLVLPALKKGIPARDLPAIKRWRL